MPAAVVPSPTGQRSRAAFVSGALKALAFQLDPVPAVLLGMLTGIGGGMLRPAVVVGPEPGG